MGEEAVNLSGDVTHTEDFAEELDLESTNVPSGSEEAEETTEAEAEETEEAETEEGETEETADSEKEPEEEPEWFKKRFAKITKRAGEAEREAATLKQQLESYKLQEAQKIQEQRQTVVSQPKPTMESCDFDEDVFSNKLTQWNQAQWEQQQDVKTQEQTRQTEQAQFNRKFEEKRDTTRVAGREKYEDFDAAIGSMPPEVMNERVAAVLFETKAPEDVAYYLSKNPAEAERISQLSTVGMAIELTRLEAKATLPPKEKIITKAPTPVTPVGKTSDANAEPNPKSDPDGWIKWERARCAKLGRRY